MATKICEVCGEPFESNYPRAKYCSEKCNKIGNARKSSEWYWTHKLRNASANKKICPVCGAVVTKKGQAKYCSAKCAYKAELERQKAKRKTTTKRKKDTLCWTCQNYSGGCSWSRSFTPVEGWEARPTKNEQTDSYHVISCPEFIPDEERDC